MRWVFFLPLAGGWPWDLSFFLEDSEDTILASTPEDLEENTTNGTAGLDGFWIEGYIWAWWQSGYQAYDAAAPGWFGLPGRPGRLRTEGGWAGYFADGVGVQAFGEWWPLVAYFTAGILMVGALGVLAYSLHTLSAPFRAVGRGLHCLARACCCCRRPQGVEAHLPSAPPTMTEVEWHGPKTGWPTETRYLQQRLKGRGSRRRLNDVVIRRDGHVARLHQEESLLKRIDSDGLRVKFSSVASCTSRQFRRDLEDAGEVHLCRQLECRAEHPLHVQEFAGVDHEALLDLHCFAHGSSRWLLGMIWRNALHCIGCIFTFTRWIFKRCCMTPARRTIRGEDGHERALDPESESEAEGDEATCQGVRVGLILCAHWRQTDATTWPPQKRPPCWTRMWRFRMFAPQGRGSCAELLCAPIIGRSTRALQQNANAESSSATKHPREQSMGYRYAMITSAINRARQHEGTAHTPMAC